jgi:crossover junction endodeoxyribonuclease RusA
MVRDQLTPKPDPWGGSLRSCIRRGPVIQLSVLGLDPAPQGSKRHVGGGRLIESSKRVKPWRLAVAHEARLVGQQVAGPCAVELDLRFTRPRSHYKANGELRTSAPRFCVVKRNDLDKCCRSTLDGLVDGGLLVDDCLVVELFAWKGYYGIGEQPGAVVRIRPLITEIDCAATDPSRATPEHPRL